MGWFDERLRNIQNQNKQKEADRRRSEQNALHRKAMEEERWRKGEAEKARKVLKEYINPYRGYVDSLMTSMGNRYWGRFRFGREFESRSWGAIWRVGIYTVGERTIAINSLAADKIRRENSYDASKYYFEVRGGPGENGQTDFTVPIVQNGKPELIHALFKDLPDVLARSFQSGPLKDYNPFNLDKS